MFGCLWKGFKIWFWFCIILVVIGAIMMAFENDDENKDAEKVDIDAKALLIEVENKAKEYDSYNIKLTSNLEQTLAGFIQEHTSNVNYDVSIDTVKSQDAYLLNGTQEQNEEIIDLNEIKVGNNAYQSLDNAPYITYNTDLEANNLIATTFGFNNDSLTTLLDTVKERGTTLNVYETENDYLIVGENDTKKISKMFSDFWNDEIKTLPSGEEVILKKEDVDVDESYWQLRVNKETMVIQSFYTIHEVTANVSDYTLRIKNEQTEFYSKFNEISEIKLPEI